MPDDWYPAFLATCQDPLRSLTLPSATPIGIDIAKAKFAAALVGGKYKTKVFPNRPAGFEGFLIWLHPFAPVPVCLEATGRYGDAMALYRVESGITVSVVNPAQIQAFGKAELSRTKTDKSDAKLIARFCYLQQPPAWQPLPPPVRQMEEQRQAYWRPLHNGCGPSIPKPLS